MAAGFMPAGQAATIGFGIVSGCVPALQPLLLGALQASGRIDTAAIGTTATVEMLGMAAGSMTAAALFRAQALRSKALLALLALAAANAATVVAPAGLLAGTRGASGLAAGVLLWLLVTMMTRAADPARIFAIYVTAQGVLTFGLSAMLTQLVLPTAGIAGGYGLLVGLAMILVPAVALLPHAPLPSGQAGPSGHARGLPPSAGILGLAAVGATLAGLFAFWVYLPFVAEAAGQSTDAISGAISVALAGQVAGGLAAIALSKRVRPAVAFVGCAGGLVVAIAAMAASESALLLGIAAFAFNVVWMFAPPFQLPLLMTLDPQHRAALYISPAQLGGMAAGPALAAAAVAPLGAAGPITVALALLAAGLLLFGLAQVAARRRSLSAPPLSGRTGS